VGTNIILSILMVGDDWTIRKTYIQNSGSFAPDVYTDTSYKFANWIFFHDTVWINESEYNFPTNMNIRFRCDDGGNNDDVYIDEVSITATHLEPGVYESIESFALPGLYNYSFWCKDVNGNTNSSTVSQFTVIVDDETLEITNVIANPSMGIQGTFVNISALVTDNAGVQDVRLNITSPDSITTNISIISNKTTSDVYYYMQDYYTVGTYTFFIWAIDVNGYTNISDSITFEIVDAPPMLSNESPSDSSVDISLNPTLSVEIFDYSNDDIDWSIRTNATGSWSLVDEGTLIGGNGIISAVTSNILDYNRIYYWSVNISDGDDWVNETYHFTTQVINTSIDAIPSVIEDNPFQITALSDGPLDNITLLYRYNENSSRQQTIFSTGFEHTGFEHISELNNWSLDPIRTTASSGYSLELSDEGDIGPRTGSYYLGGRGVFGPDFAAYNRTINISDYVDIKVSLWFSYNETDVGDNFGIYWLNGSTWEVVYENLGPQQNGQRSWTYAETSIPDSIDSLTLQFWWSTSADNEVFMIDDLNITGISKESLVWIPWENSLNPDTTSPWTWNFTFPNNTGYYDFQSIGRKSGSPDEELLVDADTNCYYQD